MRAASLLEEKLIERHDELRDALTQTVAKDYPSYRETMGQLRGLREALIILKEITKDMDWPNNARRNTEENN